MDTKILGSRPKDLPESVFVHPLAVVESQQIGAGTKVWGFSHVMKNSQVGDNCNIGEQVFIESGVVIGNRVTIKNGISLWDRVVVEDDVFLGPHMVFTNDFMPRAFIKKGRDQFSPTYVKKGATIGAGTIIVCGITIGDYAFIGAGAVVTRDIPPYGLALGNPAKLVGYLCSCTKTKFKLNTKGGSCPSCGTKNPQ